MLPDAGGAFNVTVIDDFVDVTDAIQFAGFEIDPHDDGAGVRFGKSTTITLRPAKLSTSLPAVSRSVLSVPEVGLV